MKSVQNQDERILAQKRKIQSYGYQLLVYALLISIVIQQFFLQAPPSQFMGELLCLIGAGIYFTIRHLNLGDEFYCDNNGSGKRLFRNALISGVGTVIIYTFLTGERDVWNLLSFFLIYTIFMGGGTYLMYYVSKKKKGRVEKELDRDENDID